MKNFIFTFLFVIALITPVVLIVKSIQFTQNCEGYLKQAADANTVELALDRMNKAIDYIEANDLTHGYTSVIYRTEDENVEYWYTNLKACQKELQEGINSDSQLERSNILMKTRETLTDIGEDGTVMTIPQGISRYPNNIFWAILFGISMAYIGFAVGYMWFKEEFD